MFYIFYIFSWNHINIFSLTHIYSVDNRINIVNSQAILT